MFEIIFLVAVGIALGLEGHRIYLKLINKVASVVTPSTPPKA